MKSEFDVLYEDNHLLVINKPGGMLTQRDETEDPSATDLGMQYIKEKYSKPGNVFLGTVHRLDRPVSGILALARTSKALSRMTRIFAERQIQKTYYALVLGRPVKREMQLTHRLLKNRKTNKVEVITPYENAQYGKKAVLTYTFIATVGKTSLLEIKPLTGRSHQIRVQLSAIGLPIVGDIKYGAPGRQYRHNIGLHAYSLEFEHPVKKEMLSIRAPLPEQKWWDDYRHLI